MCSIPEVTEALVRQSSVILTSLPLPKRLDKNQVLVKMLLAPINPLDRFMFSGHVAAYSGSVLGCEGVGEVLSIGDNVTYVKPGDKVIPLTTGFPVIGSFTKYCVVEEETLAKVPDNISVEEAATLYINPATAFGLLGMTELKKGDTIIQNAANSALGRAVIQLARSRGINTINIMRKRQNFAQVAEELKTIGADLVISYEDLQNEEVVKDLQRPVMAIDYVCGSSTERMLTVLQPGALLLVVGNLSGDGLSITHVTSFIINGITIKPFEVFKEISPSRMRNDVIPYITKLEFKFPEVERMSFKEYERAFEKASKNEGNHRILLVMD